MDVCRSEPSTVHRQPSTVINQPTHMQSFRLSLLLVLALLLGMPAAHAVVVAPAAKGEAVVAPAAEREMTRKEKREYRKAVQKQLKDEIREWGRSGSADTDTLLLVIIAILLPPLAMGIYEGGLTSRFWISLLLTLLFYLPGLIYTLVIILGEQ